MTLASPTWLNPTEAEQELLVQEQLMCPNANFQNYLRELQSCGQAQCTTVWTKETVAYRCRTCQINDSRPTYDGLWSERVERNCENLYVEQRVSAICVDCFKQGGHNMHEYVMYHSDSGGCCDCGDPDAWKPAGFCSSHQDLVPRDLSVPDHLKNPTMYSVRWVLSELALVVNVIPGHLINVYNKIAVAHEYLNWLQKLCSVDALRAVVCSEVVIKYLKEKETSDMYSPLQILLQTFASMPEEIMEGETTLFLQMLYDHEFKQQFSEELVVHYAALIKLVITNVVEGQPNSLKDFKALDSSLDRVMVQLFNVANMELIAGKDLLELFVKVFGDVLKGCAKRGNTVDMGDLRIVNKVYLRPQGDLRLIVAHAPVAVYVLEKRIHVFKSILDVLALLQWMNPYSLSKYVDFEEENAWTLAIQLEMNTMAIVFQLVAQCYSLYIDTLDESAVIPQSTLVAAAKCTLAKLGHYLRQGSTAEFLNSKSDIIPVSLHIPLHRTLSAILAKLVLLPWQDSNLGFLSSLDFDYSDEEVLSLMEHPLRINLWMAQIRANQWNDNSDDFCRLELIYRGSFWHDQSMDMDIVLLQFCAVARENMEDAVFLRMAKVFELTELVTTPLIYGVNSSLSTLKPSLLQDFMRLILLVVRERRHTGMKEVDCLRYDVIQWLCVRDQTYSQLTRALSAIPVDHLKLSKMLEMVAHFHDPKVQERGYYQLKSECWKEFDPLFAHFYLNELEDAQERAIHVGKLQHYWRITAPGGAKPPYNRLINLLHTQECHQLLWNVLNHVSSLVMVESTATAGEALGVTALQMLGTALSHRTDNPEWKPAETSNDVFLNVYRRPYLNIVNGKAEWGRCGSPYPSMLDLLAKLQDVKNAPRLMDSIHHVLHLLSKSPTSTNCELRESESGILPKSQAWVVTADNEQRKLKKQRQEAIMAEYKTKQNAFLELLDPSDDDDAVHGDGSFANVETGSTFGCSSANSPSLSPSFEGKSINMKTSRQSHECAFCRSECGGNGAPTGWIALVQRYNMPSILMRKREEVTRRREAEDMARIAGMNHSQESDKIASNTLGKQLVIYMEEAERGGEKQIGDLEEKDASHIKKKRKHITLVDDVPTEHVRCCGHQMHQDCFQSYHTSLVRSHCNQSTYEGKGIIELPKTEFLCPICRRLANVLLPVVHPASLGRIKLAHVEKAAHQKEDSSRFWETRNNLPEAINHFAVQSLRVRRQFTRETEAKDLQKCQVLWEVLAGNIIHCEVETREELKELASSSKAPTLSSDQRTWGGDQGHWIALRELGNLAMLSNTLETAEQERLKKRKKIAKIKEKIEEILNDEYLVAQKPHLARTFSSQISWKTRQEPLLFDALTKLKILIEGTYQSQLASDDILMKEDPTRGYPEETVRKTSIVNFPQHSGLRNSHVDSHIEERREPAPWTSVVPMRHLEGARGTVSYEGVAPGGETDKEGRGPIRAGLSEMDHRKDLPSLPSNPREFVADHTEWSSNVLNAGLLAADPFGLLIVLLSVYPGWPNLEEIQHLVKFSYIVAVTQISIACSNLQNDDDEGLWKLEETPSSVMQQACLPFLRRAALLVQMITPKELAGGNVMDATFLQEALNLPVSYSIFSRTSVEVHQLKHVYDKYPDIKPSLRAVPRELRLTGLPPIFQELLLRSLQEKCDNCNMVPMEPAVCLVCGKFLCCGTVCCAEDNFGECSKHAEEECSGIGIFLLMRSTQLMLIRGSRVCMAPSLYLDQHGEEDSFLRRSQLLHLSTLRLNEVRRLWLTAGFDSDTHILHSSQISSGVF